MNLPHNWSTNFHNSPIFLKEFHTLLYKTLLSFFTSPLPTMCVCVYGRGGWCEVLYGVQYVSLVSTGVSHSGKLWKHTQFFFFYLKICTYNICNHFFLHPSQFTTKSPWHCKTTKINMYAWCSVKYGQCTNMWWTDTKGQYK